MPPDRRRCLGARQRAVAVKYDLDTLRGDFFGGLTSMVVALPVSLGFGIASGMGPAAGLYGAIAVGFFAAVFGGTPSQISGPTAPMAVAMAVVLTTHADTLPEALTVVLLAGLFQILLGLSRIGRFVAYTPHVVVSGFMSGIGIIVIILQLMPFLGADSASGGAIGAVRALPDALGNVNTSAVAVAVVTLVVGFLWPRRLSRYAPGPLVALLSGTLLGVLWLSNAPVIGEIPTGLPGLAWEMPATAFLVTALQPALILALLGSVDSLLTSLVADSLTGRKHNPDREMIGQGIGNMVAGLFGALPGAGATMGTVINIRSGGSTRVSGALRAVFVLAVVLGLGRFAEPIPLAALAGVLMKVGWDIMDRRLLLRIHRLRSQHLVVMLVTLVLTVSVDLITAVAIGLIAGGLAHARQLERLELDSVISVPLLDRTFFGEDSELDTTDPFEARVGMVALRGSFTVSSANKLVSVIGAEIGDHEVVIFDFSETTYIDDSAAMMIAQLIDVATRSDTSCVIMAQPDSVAKTLEGLDVLREVPADRIVTTMDQARAVAKECLLA